MNGFIKWPRAMEVCFPWYKTPNTAWLFLHLVSKANISDSFFAGRKVSRGSVVTSLDNLVVETGLSKREVRTALDHLVSTGSIVKESGSRFTIITIANYDDFNERVEHMSDTLPTRDRHTSDTQATRDRHHNENIEKKEKKNIELNTVIDAWRSAGLKETDTLKNPDLCHGLTQLLEDYGENSVLRAVANVAASDFLRGQPWFGLWWFVKPDNFQKVLNGKYANREAKPEVPAQAEKPHEMTWEESEAFRKKVMGD